MACKKCNKPAPDWVNQGLAQKIKNGAMGLSKSIIGLDILDSESIEKRREICRGCEYAEPCLKVIGKFCKCKLCGCLLTHKTRLKSEKCPDGRW